MNAAQTAIGEARIAADLMLRDPKTLPADALVAEVREQLADPKVQMVLFADGRTYRGAVTAVPAGAAASEQALAYADPNAETISPGAPAMSAFERAAATAHRRVIVVDEEGSLLGLLCLNAGRTHFCQTTAAKRGGNS